MSENAGGAALSVDSSPSVADFVSNLMGDFPMSSGSESEAAGAPPVPTPEEPSTAEGSEGTTTPPETATPAPDAPSAPDSGTTPDTPEADPLEGSKPLTYVVNGQERTYEGITVLKDGGAIIDQDALERVARVFGERDHLFERDRERHAESESLGKLIEWTPPGQEKALQGRAAVEALHMSRAELMAEVRAFRELLSSPDNLRDMLVGNEDGSLAWNPLGVRAFMAELGNKKNDVRSAVSKFFADKVAQASAPQAFDPHQYAPSATQAAVKALGPAPKGWTDADKQWAESLAPRFIRLATAEDQRANPALVVGEPMVEQEFIDLVQERAAQKASTAQVVTTATDAAKANAARLAAAKVGQRPATPARPQITPQPEREKTREEEFEEAWDRRQKAAAGAMRAHAAGIGR